ncbi:hypothetical protein [Rhizobium sp. BK251]|uniref:hypothetical protein n=1 Tax=Rhizobium sp. BK251 TaxID=2512125 RepID=UPI001046002D|nr:hypothetical protein [Rhizobium sp. BK251]TCL70463.1 hypothetical protein EV286_107337 [Rhizobium sp. BK251]
MVEWWESAPIVTNNEKAAPLRGGPPKSDASQSGYLSSGSGVRSSSAPSSDREYLDNREKGFVDKVWDWTQKAAGNEWERTKRDFQTIDDLVRVTARGMTFGWADAAAGYMSGTGTEAERARTDAAKSRQGVTGALAELGGSMATTGGLMKLAPAAFGAAQGQSMGMRAVAGAGSGAAIGGLDAAGRGEDIARGAAIGAAAGGVLAPAGELAGKVGARFMNRGVEPRTSEAITAEARKLYKTADDAGVRLSQSSWNNAVEEVNRAAAKANIDPRTDRAAVTALDAFRELQGQQMTLTQAEAQRQFLNKVISNLPESDQSSMPVLMSMKGALDDWIGGLKAADIVAGDIDVGRQSLVSARKFWTARGKVEILERAFDKAENAGQPFDAAIRGQFRSIANAKDFNKRWTAPEKRAIQAVARSGGIDSLMSSLGLLGKLAVGPAVAGGGAGYAVGGPLGMGIGAGVGAVARGAEYLATTGAARDAQLLISNGTVPASIGKAGTLGRVLGMSGGMEAGKRALAPEKLRNGRVVE